MKMRMLIILLIILMIPVSLAREVTLNVDDSTTYDGKSITLKNVGSGVIVVVVDGVQQTIQQGSITLINGVEIFVIEANYHQDKAERSATLDIRKAGVICYEDNLCDYKEIKFPEEGSSFNYMGRAITIKDVTSNFIILTVDGTEATIYSPFSVKYNQKDPSSTIAVINGIGLRNPVDDSDYLYLGENFDNCPSDCSLDKEDDYELIEVFCKNQKEEIYTKEEGIDCGGLCERNCNQECITDEHCVGKCNDLGDTVVKRTCYCENYECVDVSYCEEDTDCVQVKNDACGCESISINSDFYQYWNTDDKLSKKSCLNPCKSVEYTSVCQNNMCKLTNSIKQKTQSTVYELLDKIVKEGGYTLVVGNDAPSSDVAAATAIALGIQAYSNGKTVLEAKLVNELTSESNLILLGHPCINSLIDLSCENWPYKEGEVLVKIDNYNLIIAGTTPEDTREAAGIIAEYRNNLVLKDSEVILKTQTNSEVQELTTDIETKAEINDVEESCIGDCSTQENLKDINSEDNQKDKNKGHISFTKRIWLWILNIFG